MPWYSASLRALRSSTTSITAAGDLGDPSSSLKVRSFSFRCFIMMVAAEFAVLEECVLVLVVVVVVPVPVLVLAAVLAALAPLTALVVLEELPWVSIRSSFIARLASSVSVTLLLVAVAVGDSVPVPDADALDGGEVGEVVEVGDLRGIGISRSIDF